MKVINVIYVFGTILVVSCSAVAVQPSTFGGFVDSFGRLTNTIKVNRKEIDGLKCISE